MISTDFITHKDAHSELLQAIGALKAIRWTYSMEQQMAWIADNIEPHDIHLLLREEGMLVAYMNLVQVRVEIDGGMVNALGIGNVCTKESGKGYGNELMKAVNRYLTENKLGGILFCKEHLIPYYQKFEWVLIPKENCNQEIKQVNTLIYNIGSDTSKLSYRDRMF